MLPRGFGVEQKLSKARAEALLPRPYRPVRLLGRGGEGEAWLARDETLDRLVVLKRLGVASGLQSLVGSEESSNFVGATSLESFKSLAGLSDPGAPSVFAVVEHGKQVWVVLEYVAGISLGELIAAQEGVLGFAQMLSIVADLTAALSAVHDAGLIHGDISPANVVITPEGRARFIDFGLARRCGEPMDGGGVEGFVAPELDAGADAVSTLDRFSLGCLIYWLLGEEPPRQLHDATDRVLLLYPEAPALPSMPEEVLWASARALTNGRPELRPDLSVLVSSLRMDMRHLPAGARENLGVLVSQFAVAKQADSDVLHHRDLGLLGDSSSADAEVSNSSSVFMSGFSRQWTSAPTFVFTLSLVAVALMVGIALLWPKPESRPIYSAEVSKFAVAPSTAMPSGFGEEWILRQVARTAAPHWQRGENPSIALDVALKCHDLFCQFSLAHDTGSDVHWHQQSLIASRSPGIWRGAIRDLMLSVVSH